MKKLKSEGLGTQYFEDIKEKSEGLLKKISNDSEEFEFVQNPSRKKRLK